MGIIIDLVLILIVVLSAFLGYKRGLVELGAKLFAGIIAIVLTLILFKPVSNFVINNTQVDEKLTNIIMEKASNTLDETTPVSDNNYIQNMTDSITNQLKEETLPQQAQSISQSIIYIVVALVLFIVIKIALRIIIALANLVAELPILKQFNEVGGIIYGIIRGGIIVFACILIMGIITKINPISSISKQIESTYITKNIYNMIIKF